MNARTERRVPAALLAIAFVTCGAAVSPGQGVQERVALGWVEAFNGGVDAMATFRADHFDSEATDWRDQYRTLREQWGDLEVYAAMAPEPSTFIVGVASEKEGRMRLNFSFNDANKIVEVRTGESPANSVPPLELPSDDPRPVAAIEKYLRELADQDLLSGAVLIATDGDVWFEQAYGLASREFQVPNNVDTRFDVGSLSKGYARLAINQLLEDDRLALSDTVGEYLPDYPNDRVRNEVTIEQLLTHRSGLGDMFTREYMETPMQLLREVDDYIPIWGPKPLQYEPGTREQYSNFGYTVLGAIVESITGMSYSEYVEEAIFEPAGMDDSGFFEVDGIEPNVAVGYTYADSTGRRSNTLRKNIYLEPVKGGPWGKSYSTARDVFRFYEALFAGELIGDDLNWMPAGWNAGIGLAGGGPGLSAILFLMDGVAVIVLANQDEPGAEDVGRRLVQALR